MIHCSARDGCNSHWDYVNISTLLISLRINFDERLNTFLLKSVVPRGEISSLTPHRPRHSEHSEEPQRCVT